MKTKRRPPGKQKPPLPEIRPTHPYTLDEATRLLRVRKARLRAEVPHRKDGRRYLFLGQNLLDWIVNGPRK